MNGRKTFIHLIIPLSLITIIVAIFFNNFIVYQLFWNDPCFIESEKDNPFAYSFVKIVKDKEGKYFYLLENLGMAKRNSHYYILSATSTHNPYNWTDSEIIEENRFLCIDFYVSNNKSLFLLSRTQYNELFFTSYSPDLEKITHYQILSNTTTFEIDFFRIFEQENELMVFSYYRNSSANIFKIWKLDDRILHLQNSFIDNNIYTFDYTFDHIYPGVFSFLDDSISVLLIRYKSDVTWPFTCPFAFKILTFSENSWNYIDQSELGKNLGYVYLSRWGENTYIITSETKLLKRWGDDYHTGLISYRKLILLSNSTLIISKKIIPVYYSIECSPEIPIDTLSKPEFLVRSRYNHNFNHHAIGLLIYGGINVSSFTLPVVFSGVYLLPLLFRKKQKNG